MTSFNDTIIITLTVSHQRRLRSIISRSKVSVVRSRSPPFRILKKKHFTSTSSFEVYENIYVPQDRSQTHLSIYLLISLIRSEKTFATSLTSMTFHAIYPILSYFTHWRHDGYIFLLHNEWRSRHMYILNITIICSYYGDAMKEMNRGIRSFFLLTIYTIQQNQHTIQSVSFSFSFRNPSSSLKNNISTNRLKCNLKKNIAYSNPVNHTLRIKYNIHWFFKFEFKRKDVQEDRRD